MQNQIVFLVMFVLVFTDGIQQCRKEKVFRMNSNIGSDDKKSSFDFLLWSGMVSSHIDCARVCSRDKRCVLFKYTDNSNCSTYCHSHTKQSVKQGVESLYSLVTDGGDLWNPCTAPSQCSFPHSTCNNGSCTCQLGFNFNPANKTCTKGCNRYGTDFVGYYNVSIYKHNVEIIKNASVSDSIAGCIRFGPTCRTFDYINDVGKLQEVGWNDVDPKFREFKVESSKGYTFYVRQCAWNSE